MIPEQIAGRDAASRLRMDDPHLESVAVEAEVAGDEAEEPLDRRIAADGAAAPTGAAGADSPLLQAGAVGLLHQSIEATPMGTLQPSQGFGLNHRFPFPFEVGAAIMQPLHAPS